MRDDVTKLSTVSLRLGYVVLKFRYVAESCWCIADRNDPPPESVESLATEMEKLAKQISEVLTGENASIVVRDFVDSIRAAWDVFESNWQGPTHQQHISFGDGDPEFAFGNYQIKLKASPLSGETWSGFDAKVDAFQDELPSELKSCFDLGRLLSTAAHRTITDKAQRGRFEISDRVFLTVDLRTQLVETLRVFSQFFPTVAVNLKFETLGKTEAAATKKLAKLYKTALAELSRQAIREQPDEPARRPGNNSVNAGQSADRPIGRPRSDAVTIRDQRIKKLKALHPLSSPREFIEIVKADDKIKKSGARVTKDTVRDALRNREGNKGKKA